MPEFEFEGLDIGGDPTAVDDAFAEAFRRAEDGVTPEEPTDEVTPDDESAAEEEIEGQPRDGQGRFTRTAPEVTDLEEQQAAHEQELEPEAEEVEETGDPVLDEYLAKYGGDINAAVKAAAHQNSLLGRQADEVGQLRQQLEALQARVERPVEQPRMAVPITAELVEEIDNLAMTDGRAALARVGAIGDPTGQLTDRVMDVWFATNPRQASAFQASLIAQETEKRVRAELQPIAEERAKTAEEREYEESWRAAKVAQPNLDKLAPQMEAVLTERPGLAKALLGAESVSERAALFLDVYEIAATKHGVVDPEVERIAQQEIEAEAKVARTKARVAKPSAVGSRPGANADKELTEEDRIKAGILGARDTDILSGLTHG